MAKTQLTIFQKNGMFSFLGLIQAQQVEVTENEEEDFNLQKLIAVVKLDPREGKPLLKQFETRGEAVSDYESAISTSVERGWEVVYRGVPLLG
jgi:hypothetical protein